MATLTYRAGFTRPDGTVREEVSLLGQTAHRTATVSPEGDLMGNWKAGPAPEDWDLPITLEEGTDTQGLPQGPRFGALRTSLAQKRALVEATFNEDATPRTTPSPQETFVAPQPSAAPANPTHGTPKVLSASHWQHMVPPKSVIKGWIDRPWQAGTQRLALDYLAAVNRWNLERAQGKRTGERKNPALFGPAGCGKSKVAEVFAAQAGLPFVPISGHAATDPAILIGFQVLIGDTSVFVPGLLTQALTWRGPNGEGAIVLFDEMDRFLLSFWAPFYPALAGADWITSPESGEVIKINPAVMFIGTGNGTAYAGREELDPATASRFVITHWDYDTAVEAKLLKGFASIQRVAQLLRVKDNKVTTDISLRLLLRLRDDLSDPFFHDTAIEDFLGMFVDPLEREVARGIVSQQAPSLVEDGRKARGEVEPDPDPAPEAEADSADGEVPTLASLDGAFGKAPFITTS